MTEDNLPTYKTSSLAPVQRQTLQFLRDFLASNGYAPTLKNIADHIGVKSLSTAHFHLERLEAKGFIKRGEDGVIELLEATVPQLGPTAVPLIGVIAAGMPIEAIENPQMIDLPPQMLNKRGEVFCLEVSGDSMIDEHICDGDIVIIRKQDTADDGDIVAAILDDGTATLKRFKRLRDKKIMLIPANPNFKPIISDKVTISGKMIGLLRQF
ncbi:MAG TPA: transcriptional repressor LexA [Oligoflexia bacterium]|nr:transcriptional repressor LexA [Oligoflexia bacterium]HMP26506.1 transcriptional repressor LexA [Oligoflexia bacterium]